VRGAFAAMVGSAGDRGASERAIRGLVSGRVQGVGFRWFVLQAARRHRIRGDVRNLADGRVEFRSRGNAGDLERFVEAVRQGPPASRVDRVETERLEGDTDFDDFTVR